MTWLLYDGAALRNCCRLLYEIEVAAAAGLELSVRMLGRAHMEAWLVALYIHFGGYEALLRVAQDARHSLEGIELEARQFDEWLAAVCGSAGRDAGDLPGAAASWLWPAVHPAARRTATAAAAVMRRRTTHSPLSAWAQAAGYPRWRERHRA